MDRVTEQPDRVTILVGFRDENGPCKRALGCGAVGRVEVPAALRILPIWSPRRAASLRLILAPRATSWINDSVP